MVIVRSLLLVLEVICSIMLIGLILIQKSKGGGLGTAFGGGGEGSMFGSRTGNVLTKATIVLGLVFLLNTLVLGMLFTGAGTGGTSEIDKKLMKKTAEQQPEGAPVENQMQGIPDGNIEPDGADVDAASAEPDPLAGDSGNQQSEN